MMFCDIVKTRSNSSALGTDNIRKKKTISPMVFLSVAVITRVTHPFGEKKLFTQQEPKKGSSPFVLELR